MVLTANKYSFEKRLKLASPKNGQGSYFLIKIKKVHHIAIIINNYELALQFYADILGLKLKREVLRGSRQSLKADLYLNGQYILELIFLLILLQDNHILKLPA